MAKRRIDQAFIDRMRAQGRVVDPAEDEISLPASWPLPMPPSVNELYTTGIDRKTKRARRFLTDEGRAYRAMVLAVVRGVAPKACQERDPDALLELTLIASYPWLTLKNKVAKKDASNRIKFIEDCVCTALQYDDSQHWRIVVQKSHSNTFAGVDVRLDWYRGPK